MPSPLLKIRQVMNSASVEVRVTGPSINDGGEGNPRPPMDGTFDNGEDGADRAIHAAISYTSNPPTGVSTDPDALPSTSQPPSLITPVRSSTTPVPNSSNSFTPSNPMRPSPSPPTTSTLKASPISPSPAVGPPIARATDSNQRLENGVVAGLSIGVALSVAFLTFLITWLRLRRRKSSTSGEPDETRRSFSTPMPSIAKQHVGDSDHEVYSDSLGAKAWALGAQYLPEPADDHTIINRARGYLDQAGTYVEHFYRNECDVNMEIRPKALALFDMPNTAEPLSRRLKSTTDVTSLIKHGLIYSSIASVTPDAVSPWQLLPEDFTLLPRLMSSVNGIAATKPGFNRLFGQWRVLTAYLRPNSSDDPSYLARRDRQVDDFAETFVSAFAPWSDPQYAYDVRKRSLAAVLRNVTALGMFLFSQPCDLRFRWLDPVNMGPKILTNVPALIKLTDTKGHKFSKPQTLVGVATP